MYDKVWTVSATNLAASLLWVGAVGLLVTAFLLGGDLSPALGMCASVLSMVAMTVTVRGFFCTFGDRMKTAFDYGREVGRSEQDAARLRKV